MKNILLVLLISVVGLSAGTLRILNIPVNSTIEIDGKKYENKRLRSYEIEIENKLLTSTYSLIITNEDFIDYNQNITIKDDELVIKTLDMQYAREFYTSIFVEDVSGRIDACKSFKCSVESGEYISLNLYKYNENDENDNVDFTVERKGYYDETDSYDVFTNQSITIAPVSSWGLFGIGFVSGIYGAIEDLELSNGDEYMKYMLEDTTVTGGRISYKKNTPINIYFGLEANMLFSKETQDEEDPDLTDDLNYNGVPSISVLTLGTSIGYRYRRFFIDGGIRQESIIIEKTYTDKSYTYEETKTVPYVSFNFLWWSIGNGGMTIGLNASENISTVSLDVVF